MLQHCKGLLQISSREPRKITAHHNNLGTAMAQFTAHQTLQALAQATSPLLLPQRQGPCASALLHPTFRLRLGVEQQPLLDPGRCRRPDRSGKPALAATGAGATGHHQQTLRGAMTPQPPGCCGNSAGRTSNSRLSPSRSTITLSSWPTLAASTASCTSVGLSTS